MGDADTILTLRIPRHWRDRIDTLVARFAQAGQRRSRHSVILEMLDLGEPAVSARLEALAAEEPGQ